MNENDQKTMFSSDSDEWCTPNNLFEYIQSMFGVKFTLDPATDGKNSKCAKFFTAEQDGLQQSWQGEYVFVNPPYSHVDKWVKKAYDEVELTKTLNLVTGQHDVQTYVCLLIPARTDTKWAYEYVRNAAMVKFIKGRVKFDNGQAKRNSAPFPSMLVVFDSDSTATNNPYVGWVDIPSKDRQ